MAAGGNRHARRASQKRVRAQEMIGRYVLGDAQVSLFKSRARVETVDKTIADYEFWDKLRRGKAKGYSLGGLFAKRIERVFASWVLGGGVEITLAKPEPPLNPPQAGGDTGGVDEDRMDYTNAQLAQFMAGLLDAGQDDDEEDADPDRDDRQNSLLLSVFRDSLGLGDQYIFVNPDGSLSVPSVDTVTVKRDPLDYRRVLSVTIETKSEGYTITDEYRADGRTVMVKKGAEVVSTQEFQNLIGRIPVVHVAHGMSGNETYGHPIHEELRPLYDEYDDVIYKQLDGVKLLGNPLLAFTGMEDINAVINANQPAEADTYTDKDGNEATRHQLNIDTNAVMLVGKGGDAKYVAPPVGFTADTQQALKTLFLLLLDHTGIPEFVWGNEMSSARASSDTQMDQFARDIEGWRRDSGGWVVRLCKIWLQTRALTDRRILLGRLAVKWPSVTKENRELLLKFIEFAKNHNLLTDETALRMTNLVENVEEEAEAAAKEAEERQEAMFPEGDTAAFGGRLGQPGGQTEGDEE